MFKGIKSMHKDKASAIPAESIPASPGLNKTSGIDILILSNLIIYPSHYPYTTYPNLLVEGSKY